MALGEFELIAKYFARPAKRAVLGVGDDCALLAPSAGMQWAVSTDMLLEGRHFLSTVSPERLGHKALAVNLSDLAACGAKPVAFTLALAMPRIDENFVAGFAQGLYALADAQAIELVGGDTCAGPLTISITVIGELPADTALRRGGARAGDQIWVSHAFNGGLGDARLALEVFRGKLTLAAEAFERVRRAMELPQPRVQFGQLLRGVASSAIDLSDGLLGDLGHILESSALGATLQLSSIPRSADLAAQAPELQRQCLLGGGDDYELLFTAPQARAAAVRAAAQEAGLAATPIGTIDAAPGLRVLDERQQLLPGAGLGFDHFKD